MQEFIDGIRFHGHGIEPGIYGKRLVIKGGWSSDVTKLLQRHKIKELNINYARGFIGNSIEFLREVSFIEALSVLSYWVNGISPIEALTNLRSIHIGTRPEKTAIDFRCFPKLERVFTYWRPKAETLFDCVSLQELRLNGCRQKALTRMLRLKNLVELSLTGGSLDSLEGIENLLCLERLDLAHLRHLQTLDHIGLAGNLKTLELNSCKKVTCIDPVSSLRNLKVLRLDDCGAIDSLGPIANCKQLEVVTFYGTTKVADGDMRPLFELPKLTEVRYADRRHYTHHREVFPGPFHKM